jgi:WD40 repeat protein
MPLQVKCPECGKFNTVEEKHLGKRIRCKKCDESFVAEGQDGRPRQSQRRDESRRSSKELKSGMTGAMLASIIAGAVVLVGGGVGLYFWLSKEKPKQVATAPDPAQPVGEAAAPERKAPTDEEPKQKSNPKGKKNQPKKDLPKDFGPPKDPAPATDVVWNAKPDPLPEPVELPADAQGSVNITGFTPMIVFPNAPSTFVCLTQKGPKGDVREVWDLRGMKKIGTVDIGPASPAVAISPDGKFIAAKDHPLNPPGIVVWSVADGKQIAKMPFNERFVHEIDVDFITGGKLLTGRNANSESIYQIWDIPTSTEVHQFKVEAPINRKKRAISATGKYLALTSNKNDRALVYDLTSGQLAGEAVLEEKNFFGFNGLGFSQDGTKLSAFYAKKSTSHIAVWDMNTGKLLGTSHLPKDLDFLSGMGTSYDGSAMEWLPDGTGWFIFGNLLVDAKAVALYWTIPGNRQDVQQRRIFGNTHLVRAYGEGAAKVMKLEKLPVDQIATALKGVSHGSGGDAGETERLTLTAPDWKTAKKLAISSGTDWQAKPDPGTSPKSKLAAKPIPLRGKTADQGALLFTGAEAAQTAILSSTTVNELSSKRAIKADRYDLVSGKHLGTTDLVTYEPPDKIRNKLNLEGDLSPDGSLLMLRRPKRIDIWTLADGKHFAGFSPLDKGSNNAIRWAMFVDEHRVLTLSGPRLALWDIPSCKVIWFLIGVATPPALSPGHNQLAVFSGSSFDVIDVTRGDKLGTFDAPGIKGIGAAAYRQDGKQLAALMTTTEGKNSLTRWDVSTGKVIDGCAASVLAAEMAWSGENHVLVGDIMFDLELGWPVSHYTVGWGRQSNRGPDGRHWFTSAANDAKPGVLTAQTLPDAATREFAGEVKNKTLTTVLAPGMTVAVQIQNGPPGVQDFQRQALEGITNRLRSSGFQVGTGSNLVLTVGYQGPRGTGETRQYETVGINKSTINVTVQAVDGVATLRDTQGVLNEQKQTYQMPDSLFVQTNDIQGTLTKQMWEQAASFPTGVGLPMVIVRGPKGVQVLPRPVMLAGDK